RLQRYPVREIHLDVVGIGDDMVVGDDDTLFGVDNETGAERLHLLRAATFVAIAVLEEVVEEILEWRSFGQLRHWHGTWSLSALHRLRGRDIDHGAKQALRQIGNRCRTMAGRGLRIGGYSRNTAKQQQGHRRGAR